MNKKRQAAIPQPTGFDHIIPVDLTIYNRIRDGRRPALMVKTTHKYQVEQRLLLAEQYQSGHVFTGQMTVVEVTDVTVNEDGTSLICFTLVHHVDA